MKKTKIIINNKRNSIIKTKTNLSTIKSFRISIISLIFFKISGYILSNVYFLMIGEGSERESMENQIERLGIRENCRLTGFLENVPEVLKNTVDIYLFTSGFEGLGLALVEAQAAGVYSIYSDVVPQEAVINPQLVKSMSLLESPTKWAQTLIDAIPLAKEKENEKEKSYNLACSSNFNIKSVGNIYNELWLQIIKEHNLIAQGK